MLDNKFGRWLDKIAGVPEPIQDEQQRARDGECYEAGLRVLSELYPTPEQQAEEAAYFRREPGKLGLAMIELDGYGEPRDT